MDKIRDNKSAYNSEIYDDHIINVLPYYREYFEQIIDLVKAMGIRNPDWLDTGFRSADLLWTSYLQAGFWAIK